MINQLFFYDLLCDVNFPNASFFLIFKKIQFHKLSEIITQQEKPSQLHVIHSVFFYEKSNIGAEAERSYCFGKFEPEMFLRCS